VSVVARVKRSCVPETLVKVFRKRLAVVSRRPYAVVSFTVLVFENGRSRPKVFFAKTG